ncbi:glycerophosphodiester phosphodiesterase family protein [Hymenobacter seoulensis]
MITSSRFPEVHGHRGCRGLRPENTLPAFLHAVRLGVDVLEMDVVISADNQVVVSHEPWMSATICRLPSGLPIATEQQRYYNLYALPYAETRQFDCGLTRHPLYPEQVSEPAYKPLLREVILAADTLAHTLGRAPVRYSIELKSEPSTDGVFHPAPARFLELVLGELQAIGALPRTTLLCFDKRVLQVAKQVVPQLPVCLLVEDQRPLSAHLSELGFHPSIYGPNFRLLTPELVGELQRLDVGLVPWTVNEPADLLHILSYNPTGITTDFPDRLLALRSV